MRHLTLALLALAVLFAGPAPAQTLAESIARGKAVYDAKCVNCHLGDGKGAKPLDGSKVVLYDTAAQLKKVLDGAVGMPSWKDLTDTELADVITFTKNTWSNQTGVLVQPAAVGQARLRTHSCFQAQFLVPRPPLSPGGPALSTAAGSVIPYWCALPTRAGDQPNKIYWAAQGFVALKKYTSDLALVAAAGRVAVASDSWGQLTREILAIQVKPAPGSQDAYEMARLHWMGCEALRTGPPPNGMPFDTPLAADYCGPAPVAPLVVFVVQPYGTAVYRSTFPVLDGKRSTTSNGRVPVVTGGKPTPVDCTTTRIVEGSALFCAIVGNPSTVVPARAAP
jgi:mono/diheme cytochrome c family protein